MKNEAKNTKTARVIYNNIMMRYRKGDNVTVKNYFINAEVEALLNEYFTDNMAVRIGLREPREVPKNIEALLEKAAKNREAARYEELKNFGRKAA